MANGCEIVLSLSLSPASPIRDKVCVFYSNVFTLLFFSLYLRKRKFLTARLSFSLSPRTRILYPAVFNLSFDLQLLGAGRKKTQTQKRVHNSYQRSVSYVPLSPSLPLFLLCGLSVEVIGHCFQSSQTPKTTNKTQFIFCLSQEFVHAFISRSPRVVVFIPFL